jgi:hypothetical protein
MELKICRLIKTQLLFTWFLESARGRKRLTEETAVKIYSERKSFPGLLQHDGPKH